MSLLKNIDNSLVGYVPGIPGFLDLVTQELGNLGTAADGFDAAMNTVMLAIASTDAAFLSGEAVISDMFSALAVFEALDTAGLVLDFTGTVPVLSQFQYNVDLQTVGGLKLPTLPRVPPGGPPLPGPPPVPCVPAPPPPCVPAPQPPGTGPPPPPPSPAPKPCAPGTQFSPTQGCIPIQPPVPKPLPPLPLPPPRRPCPIVSALIMPAPGDPCAPEPTPPPAPTPAPPPPSGGPTPLPLPLPPPIQPCPPGTQFISTQEGCQPTTEPSGGTQLIDGVLAGILAGGIQTGTNAAAMFGGGLPLIATLPALVAGAFIPVIDAFVLFNSIFGSWQAEFNQWAAAMEAWAAAHPVGFAIYTLQQQITEWQAAQRQVGSYEYQQLQNLIDRDTKALDALRSVESTTLTPAQQSALVVWANEKSTH